MPRWPWQRNRKAAPVDTIGEVGQHPVPPLPVERFLRRDYVYPDYVDSGALEALAGAKGVVIDPMAIGFSRSATSGWSSGTEISGSLRTPVGDIGSRMSETESEERSIGHSIEMQRRQTMRWVVDELARILRSEGALHEDLALIPPECENELRLGEAVRHATREWV